MTLSDASLHCWWLQQALSIQLRYSDFAPSELDQNNDCLQLCKAMKSAEHEWYGENATMKVKCNTDQRSCEQELLERRGNDGHGLVDWTNVEMVLGA